MTVLFDGRFNVTPDFSLYARIDREPVPQFPPPLVNGDPGSYEIVDDPAGSGEKVAKLTCPAAAPGRIELRPFTTDPLPGSNPDWGEAWYAWWTYIPNDWKDSVPNSIDTDTNGLLPNTRIIIAQLHQTEDVTDTPSFPLMSLMVIGNRYYLATVHDTGDPTVSRVPNLRVLRSWPVVKGVWEEWVYRSNVTLDANGTRYFYRNRRLQYSVTGTPSGQNDVLGPFFKAGLYTYANYHEPDTRVIYSKGIKIATASYEEATGHSLLETPSIRMVC